MVDRTWGNIYSTFSSSLGSTLLLIERGYNWSPILVGYQETRLKVTELQVFKCQGRVEHWINVNHLMIAEFNNNHWMPRTLGRPSSSIMRKSSISRPRSMTCKTKTMSMNTDLRGWVWLQIWGSRRLVHFLWWWTYDLEDGWQAYNIINSIIAAFEERDLNTWVWALPLATAKLGGVPRYRITITYLSL